MSFYAKYKQSEYSYHGNIKCDCGCRQADHYQGDGFCYGKHLIDGKTWTCGCTWFHPSVHYIKRRKAMIKAKHAKRRKRNVRLP